MGGTIIPLRLRSEGRFPLDRIDRVAVRSLADGKATSLRAARIAAILADLQVQRDRFVTILADLRGQRSGSHVDTATANAALALTIAQGIVQIDAFLTRIRASMAEMDERGASNTMIPQTR